MGEHRNINSEIFEDIAERIQGIIYGTVTISIYDARIVEVDVTRTERMRFDDIWLHEDGGGI
ncbi:MAG: YezD family protein [Desulfobacteraceae bacterium]|nr:YezD family protein [Desulfobacteraceae bacterium]